MVARSGERRVSVSRDSSPAGGRASVRAVPGARLGAAALRSSSLDRQSSSRERGAHSSGVVAAASSRSAPLRQSQSHFGMHSSPSTARLGRHFFPERADSLRDLSVLAGLVDDRSQWYESARKTDDEIRELSRGAKKRREVREYYERMNGILDMWREVDQIVDSRFPAEVLKRFGNIDGAEQLERGVSGYTSDEESDAEGPEFTADGRRRGSIISRTASGLFSGLWFGKEAAKKRPGVHDEESNLLSSDSGMVSSPRRLSSSLRGYGAASSNLATSFTGPQGLSTIEAGVEVPPGEGLAEPSAKPDKAGVVRSRTPKGVRPAALEHVPKQKRIVALNGSAKDGNGSSGGGDADSETEEDESEVDGSLDRKLAAQRAERKARDRQRTVHIPGGPDLRVERSTSSGPNKAPSEAGSNASAKLASVPGGLRERERRKLLAYVPGKAERDDEEEKKASFAININLAVNVLLLGGKGFAVLSSNSVSLLASLVDSALDLLSTLIIFGTSVAISHVTWRTWYAYPTGRKRLEPLGVVIFSVLMIASFAQVLLESVQRLIGVIRTGKAEPGAADSLPLVGIAFMLLTIGIKACMWLIYRTSKSSGVRAVAQDAENDVVFNIASLIFPFLGSKLGWPALDPIGGSVLSIYILVEWGETLLETVSRLTGAAAGPDAVAQCLYLVTRFRAVKSVSAFEVYFAGDHTVCEVDIVLGATVPLKDAHDLGECVTYTLESLDEVERAYIHLDYAAENGAGHLAARG